MKAITRTIALLVVAAFYAILIITGWLTVVHLAASCLGLSSFLTFTLHFACIPIVMLFVFMIAPRVDAHGMFTKKRRMAGSKEMPCNGQRTA